MFGRMNNNKRLGSNFERHVLKFLQARGYYAVRSAGSHNIVDILAVGCRTLDGPKLFIQCKKGGELPPAEWNELFSTATRYRAKPLLARAGGRGDPPMFFEIVTPKVPRPGRAVTGPYDGGEKDLYLVP